MQERGRLEKTSGGKTSRALGTQERDGWTDCFETLGRGCHVQRYKSRGQESQEVRAVSSRGTESHRSRAQREASRWETQGHQEEPGRGGTEPTAFRDQGKMSTPALSPASAVLWPPTCGPGAPALERKWQVRIRCPHRTQIPSSNRGKPVTGEDTALDPNLIIPQ